MAYTLKANEQYNALTETVFTMPGGYDAAAPCGIRNIGPAGLDCTLTAAGGEGFWNTETQTADASIDTHIAPHRSALYVFYTGKGWVEYISDEYVIRDRGTWDATKTYHRGDQAVDGSWLSIANKTTTERLAPQLVGSMEWITYPEEALPSWSENTTSSTRLLTGLRVAQSSTAGLVGSMRVWIPYVDAGIRYSVLVTSPDDPTVDYVDVFPTEPGWLLVTDVKGLRDSGTDIDVYLVTQGAGTSTETFEGEWDIRFIGANPRPDGGPQLHKFWVYQTNSPDTIYWQVEDQDNVDRTADIGTLIAGDQVSFEHRDTGASVPNGNVTTWTLTENPVYYDGSGSNNGEPFFDLRVGPQPTPEGDQKSWRDITGTHFLDRPIDYVQMSNTFAGNPNLRGLFGIGGLNDVGETDNSYGVDLFFQEVEVSEDWEIRAWSGTV